MGTDVGGTTPVVTGLAVLPDSELVAVGSFFSIGGVSAAGVARWNGTNWLSFGSGVLGSAECVAVLSSGDLVVGGTINSIASVPVNNLGRGNGTNWSGFGSGLNNAALALQPSPEGKLFVGGRFGTAGVRVASPGGVVERRRVDESRPGYPQPEHTIRQRHGGAAQR